MARLTIDNVTVLTTPQSMMAATDLNFTELYSWTDQDLSSDASPTFASVGIGTATIPQKLTIDAGNVLLSNNQQIRFKDSGGTERTAVYFDSSDDLNIGTSAGGNLKFINGSTYTEAMRIDSAGNVGIGTVSPDTKAHILDSGEACLTLESSDGYASVPSTRIDALLRYNSVNSTTHMGRIVFSKNNATDGDTGAFTAFYNKPAGATIEEAMRITSAGNVGIGDTDPSGKLSIISSSTTSALRLSGTVNNYIAVLDAGSTSGQSYGPYIKAGTTSADRSLLIQDATGQNPHLVVRGDGNVGIGTLAPVSAMELSNTTPVISISNSDTIVSANQLLGALNFYSRDTSTTSTGGVGGIRMYAQTDYNTSNTPSYMSFYTHSTSVNNGTELGNPTERMRIDSSGNIGIGTSSPNVKVEAGGGLGTAWVDTDASVSVASVGSDSAVEIVSTDAGTWGSALHFHQVDGTAYENTWSISRQTNGDGGGDGSLNFKYGTDARGNRNSSLVTIDSTGNVGIGTTSPQDSVHIAEDAYTGALRMSYGVGGENYYWRLGYLDGSNDLQFANRDGSAAEATHLTIKRTSGNIGIGTTAPGANLHVTKTNTSNSAHSATTLVLEDTGQQYMSFLSDGASEQGILWADSGSTAAAQVSYAHSTGLLLFNAENYFNFTGANVGINNSAPTGLLEIGTFSDTGASQGSQFIANGRCRKSSMDSTSLASHNIFYNPTGTVGSISTSGSSTIFSTSSDYRLKENLQAITGACDTLELLPVWSFNFKADPDTRVSGFMAHELQA
ncbi:MAG: tail fiber domain-containing protein, partial [Desulfobulbaceae bacterium]|nr:tail fiber domain-containing protein [Desulfobulbaceae bacterium]